MLFSKANALNVRRASCISYDVDNYPRDYTWFVGDLKSVRKRRSKLLEDDVAIDPKHTTDGSAHANVAYICGSARQYRLIGGRDVGMSSHHGRNPAIQVISHRDLFTRRLRMKVDEAVRGVDRVEQHIDLSKRVAIRLHIDSPAKVHHRQFDTLFGDRAQAFAWRFLGHVVRTHNGTTRIEKGNDVAFVKRVITQGNRVGSRRIELLCHIGHDADPPSGVLAIDDCKQRLIGFDERRQTLPNDGAPGPTNDVSQEQNFIGAQLGLVTGFGPSP